ncbi:MAG: FAD:protein FMN transferase [Pirellulaceae bacterium]
MVGLLLTLGCEPPVASPSAEMPPLVETRGRTMGTAYLVKISNPPASLPDDWKQQVDLELRRVNDQMSTYLKSSELSQFNASQSTDWFSVSAETAEVVSYALDVAELTDGAFDVTIGPLVNAWSFGPDERSNQPPSEEEIARLKEKIGFQHLEAREQPPALRKKNPAIEVDLSAIAKGHGVDRVIERLKTFGVENAFVEIGGEVRVIGVRGDRPWGVGIQQPDTDFGGVLTAVPLSDGAIATSGDYRNFFESEGQRFSHTIDPRTGRPVTHNIASVSVAAKNCMVADAWATAITVLGAEAGKKAAEQQGLDILLLIRQKDGFETIRTGVFAEPPLSKK